MGDLLDAEQVAARIQPRAPPKGSGVSTLAANLAEIPLYRAGGGQDGKHSLRAGSQAGHQQVAISYRPGAQQPPDPTPRQPAK